MNLKQEVGLYIDLYMSKKQMASAEVWENVFYGNERMLYNSSMMKHEATLPILETFEIQHISEHIEAELVRQSHIEWNTLESFKNYKKINKQDYVAMGRKGILLKTFKSIWKMLEDYENVTCKCEDYIIFYAWGKPMVIVAPVMIDIQTSLIPEKD